MPSSGEEKPQRWVNLLEVNEDFGDKRSKRAFLVNLLSLVPDIPITTLTIIIILIKIGRLAASTALARCRYNERADRNTLGNRRKIPFSHNYRI